MRPPVLAVAFDLDGTLVDSAPDIAHALNTALRQARLQTFDPQQVRRWIGDGPDALIGRALAAQGDGIGPAAPPAPQSTPPLAVPPAVPPAVPMAAQLRRDFDLATLADPLGHGRVFDGVAELLRELALRLPLAVVTNKPTLLARAVLQAAGLLGLFGQVMGADLQAHRKPAPAMLHELARRLELECAGLLMVGDSPADMGAARAAGCPAALVAWGYGHQAVTDTRGLWQVTTPAQLRAGLLA